MRNERIDKRKSLRDLHIERVEIGGKTYILQGDPKRGGSCLVYTAMKQERSGDSVYEHRVLLKEFYPLMGADKNAGVQRKADGTFIVPEAIRASDDYRRNLERFRESYRIMLELGNSEMGAEHMTVAVSLTEALGTWYVEEAYDSGEPLDVFLQKHPLELRDFLNVFYQCLTAVERLHRLGYYHLDLKPQNIACTKNIVIKLFDTDSFVKKADLKTYTILSWTKDYSAPEIEAAVRTPEDIPYMIGPWTDVYSLAQTLCWYLFGHPVTEEETERFPEMLLEAVREKTRPDPEDPLKPYSLFSNKGVYMLEHLLLSALSFRWKERPSTVTAFKDGLVAVCQELFAPEEGVPLADNFILTEGEPYKGDLDRDLEKVERFFTPEACVRGPVGEHEGMVICSASKEERETLARCYAAIHRMDYQCVMELRCESFSQIPALLYEDYKSLFEPIVAVLPDMSEEGRGVFLWERHLPRLKNWLEGAALPLLLLIHDGKGEGTLDKGEEVIMDKVLGLPNCDILITGSHNRCQDTDANAYDLWTLDLDAETKDGSDEDDMYVPYRKRLNKRRIILACRLLAVLIAFFAGRSLVAYGARVAQPLAFAVEHTDACLYYKVRQSPDPATLIYAAGAGLAWIGILQGLFGWYRYREKGSVKTFLRSYIPESFGLFTVLLALAVPGPYTTFSKMWLELRYGLDRSTTDFMFYNADLWLPILGFILLLWWIYHIVYRDRREGIIIRILGLLSGFGGIGCILLKTWESRGDMAALLLVSLAVFLLLFLFRKDWKRKRP